MSSGFAVRNPGKMIGTETSEIKNLVNAEHSEELLPRFRTGKIQPRSLDFSGGTAHAARNA
jgi:hypothetical protein